MLFKKKATSKTPKKKKGVRMATDTTKTTTPTTTSAPGGSAGTATTPPDPFKSIQERQAAAEAPTKAVESGEVKPPQPKPTDTKKPDFVPANLTGVEQMQVTTSGMQPGPMGPREDQTKDAPKK